MIFELAVRAGSTALIVIAATLAIERFGPRIGGSLAGLPIVIGPGFFFLIRDHGAAFAADAAATSLFSLAATEAFLLGYCLAAQRAGPFLSLAAAILAWLTVVPFVAAMPPMPFLGAAVFTASGLAAYLLVRAFAKVRASARGGRGLAPLLLRGLLAGLLVAGVTVLSAQLGAAWSGLLVTFPVGFTVISVTVHQRAGSVAAIATLNAAMLGTFSLAIFSFGLAVGIPLLGSTAAYGLALLGGLAATSFLTLWSRQQPGGTG